MSRVFSNTKVIAFFGVLSILAALMLFLEADDCDLSDILQGVSLLNITVTIGLGAIAISLKKDEKTLILLKEIIFIMIISIMSYFLSFLNNFEIQRLYLFVSSFILVSILLSVAKHIQEYIVAIELSKKRKKKKKKKKKKRKRKRNYKN